MKGERLSRLVPGPVDKDEIADSFGRKASFAIGVSTIGFAVAFLGSIVVARLLGAEGKGTFSLFIATVGGLGTFASFGIDRGQMYHAARSPEKLDHFFPNAVVISLALGGGVAALYFLGGHYADVRIASLGGLTALAGILFVPVDSMLKFQKQYLVTIHQYVLSRTNMAIQQALPLAAAIALFPFLEVTVERLIVTVTAGMMVLLVSYHLLMQRRLAFQIDLSPRRFSLRFAAESLSFGVRQYLSDLTLFLTNRLDFFLVAWFLGMAELGVYSVAVALSEVVLRVPRELGVVLFPVFASGSLRHGQAASFLRRMNVIAIFSAAVLGFASEPIVRFLFGTEFEGAVTVFRWLLPGAIAWSTIQVTWNRVSAGGRPGLGVPIFGGAAAIDAGLNVILLPQFGVVGAAFAATVSYTLAAVTFLALFCRRENCSMTEAVLIRRQDVRDIFQGIVSFLKGEVRARSKRRSTR